VYLLVFIQNLLVNLAEKILPMQPLTFGGDYPSALARFPESSTCQKPCALDPTLPDLGSKHRAKPLPPEPDGFMTDLDAALVQ